MPGTSNNLSVREMKESELEQVITYFLSADDDFLLGMGVDVGKLPQKEAWLSRLQEEYRLPPEQKKLFYVAWLQNETTVGHSHINQLIFGKEAFMHLHLWQHHNRQKGSGTEFVRLSLPFYFNIFHLEKLYCEPYALNPAPNKTMEKLGFDFIERHETIPGPSNFYQPVNKWCLERGKFERLYPDKSNVRA
jgi:ribosomal-protein-alanine N-acetyltransferase